MAGGPSGGRVTRTEEAERSHPDAGPGHGRVPRELLGLGADQPARRGLREQLGLTAFQQSLLVAVPVIVGRSGRIPVGALTDRLGARVMFPAVSFLTILPVLFSACSATATPPLLIGGFFLGLGGTAFAVGVPLRQRLVPARPAAAWRSASSASAWAAPRSRRSPPCSSPTRTADAFPFVLVAVVLAVYGVVAALLLRDGPGRPSPRARSWPRTCGDRCGMPATLQLSLLYAVGFGGFVAFSVYLPTYLVNAYDLTQADAAPRTAGFVVLAVVMRPVGGWLSDQFAPGPGAHRLLRRRGRAGRARRASFLLPRARSRSSAWPQRSVRPRARCSRSSPGSPAGQGRRGHRYRRRRRWPRWLLPPLVMGAIYGSTGSYAIGFLLLAVVALAAAAYTWLVLRREART